MIFLVSTGGLVSSICSDTTTWRAFTPIHFDNDIFLWNQNGLLPHSCAQYRQCFGTRAGMVFTKEEVSAASTVSNLAIVALSSHD